MMLFMVLRFRLTAAEVCLANGIDKASCWISMRIASVRQKSSRGFDSGILALPRRYDTQFTSTHVE